MTGAVPKAELHVHLEGTVEPALVRRLAARHGMRLPETLFNGESAFAWTDFADFLRVYDAVCHVIRTPADYAELTYDYLARSAREGVVYAELTTSPDHAASAGMAYGAMVEGVAEGITRARGEYGIEAFMITSCVRHFGVERAVAVAREAARNPHPLVVGFGMGGDEIAFPPGQFAPAFRIASEEAGLACTVHAGEFDGPPHIREALETLPVTRLGHGVRASEDAALARRLAEDGIVLECCPSSNIATGVYASLDDHPFARLRAAGCIVTLSSDDPPYFHTSVGREYALAAAHFGLDDEALRRVTRDAIEAGFAPADLRRSVLEKAGLS